ncbi:MAG: hypothetical protein ABWW66_02930 [Archaeoglobaceae archaeon]
MEVRVETDKDWLEEFRYVYAVEGVEEEADIVKAVLALEKVEVPDTVAVEFQVTQKKTITIKTRSGSRRKSSSRIIAYKSFYDMLKASLYIASNRMLRDDEREMIEKAISEKIKKPVRLEEITSSQGV